MGNFYYLGCEDFWRFLWYDDTFVGLTDQSRGELCPPVANIGGRSHQKGDSDCVISVVVKNQLIFLVAGNIKKLSTGAPTMGKAKKQKFVIHQQMWCEPGVQVKCVCQN